MIQTTLVTARVKQIVRSDHMGDEQILSHVQTRYEHLLETFGWGVRKRDLIISPVAQVESTSATTVTVTLDSATVTAIGTPFTAAMSGRQIQIGDEPTPFFLTYSSTSVVTLQDGEGNAVTWPRATDTAASWRVFQSLYDLPAGADSVLWLGTDVPLREYEGGRGALNRADPNRQTTDSQPLYWCHAGTSTATTPRRQIELWPVPTSGRIIRGEYQREAPILTAISIIDLPTPLIVFASAADCFGALYALTGDEAHQKAQLFYERKANEVMNDYGPVNLANQSLPTTFGRTSYSGPRGDFLVSHQALDEFDR